MYLVDIHKSGQRRGQMLNKPEMAGSVEVIQEVNIWCRIALGHCKV